MESGLSFSPSGKYLSGYDGKKRQYFIIDPVSLKRTDSNIPTAIYDELEDVPVTPNPYGEAGWTQDDTRLLVYDMFDIWSIDPTGKNRPVNLTSGFGRARTTRLRYANTDPEAHFIDLKKPILLAAFDEETKGGGFYTLNVSDPSAKPVKLLSDNKLFTSPIKAKNADVYSYTRQDFVEFPDVWVSKSDFTERRKLSNANPQQANFNWGKAELVNWISSDGQKLQGILIKPENFSYAKKYPMITYFYERNSDTLNAYRAPAPSAG
jgi:dipeptidyl aminopeptidase/acylaminoacyl peptidase